jgi:hypothetical protein
VTNTIASQLPAYFCASDIRAFCCLHGVGDKTRDKLLEIFSTGGLRRAGAMRDDPNQLARRELVGVWGVGYARADELIEKGVTTIEQVWRERRRVPSPLPQAISSAHAAPRPSYVWPFALRCGKSQCAAQVHLLRKKKLQAHLKSPCKSNSAALVARTPPECPIHCIPATQCQ